MSHPLTPVQVALFMSLSSLAALVAPQVASAAESDTPTGASSVERVQVTGSHIKRLAVEGAAPIATVTRKELESSGYNSVADVLRDNGASSFGGLREQSGSNAAGVAHVDLRGLGSSNTLVLLNGQRLPTDAVTGAVDLNLIPMAAVERIEILKDGASATYGSDALGGVVNIITRKDFSGTEARVSRASPEQAGGSRLDLSIVNGINREKLNLVTTLQFRDNSKIMARDRPWSDSSQSLLGGPGSYRNGSGQWFADQNCPPELLVSTPQGQFCSYNPNQFMTSLPDLQQFGLMSEANYELSSRVKLTARVGGTQRRVNWSYAPAPGIFTIPAATAATLGLPGYVPGDDLTVRYRLTELGTRDTEVNSLSYNALLGTQIQLSDDWNLELTSTHNAVRSSDRGVNGYALRQGLVDAITSGAYNPFAAPGAKGDLAGVRYVPEERTTSLLSTVEAKAAGPLAELPSGALSMALGASVTHQEYADIFDEKSVNGEVFGNAGSSGRGGRRMQAIFSELAVPLDSKLELNLAGRFDSYSDFGSTTNPKAALQYRPTRNLLLRSSVGTGFRAPLMQELYQANSQGFPTFIDFVACNAERQAGGATPSCEPQQYEVTSGGNPGLREQKSVSWNVGAVFEPSREFNVGTDFFVTRMTNVVGIDYTEAMRAASKGIDLNQYGVKVKRDSNGYIESVEAPLQNLSAQQVSGLDLSAAYRLGDFRLATEQSQLFYFNEEGFPGSGMRDRLGEYGRPSWRNTSGITWLPNDRHDLSLRAMTIPGQKKIVMEKGRISSFTSLDLAYSYKSKTLGLISLGVQNLLGTTPPLDDSNPNQPLNVNLYGQSLRQYVVSYARSF